MLGQMGATFSKTEVSRRREGDFFSVASTIPLIAGLLADLSTLRMRTSLRQREWKPYREAEAREEHTFDTERCRTASYCCQSMFDLNKLARRREGCKGEPAMSGFELRHSAGEHSVRRTSMHLLNLDPT
jgi:hypothetical protein